MTESVAPILGQGPPELRRQRGSSSQRQRPPRPRLRGTPPGPSRAPDGARPFLLDGQVCGLFAVDIVGFNKPRRDDDVQLYVHKSLYDMLEAAFDSSGVPWPHCAHEDRGDGALVVMPPVISAARLVHPIPDKLLGLVRRHNRVSCDAARIQLRMAVHIGPVHHDGHGFVGHTVNHLYRMLDAPAVKRMITGSGAEIAYITSSYLYENVVVRRPSLVIPDMFKPVTVRVKETRARAWAYTLGAAAPSTINARDLISPLAGGNGVPVADGGQAVTLVARTGRRVGAPGTAPPGGRTRAAT